jgi:hypothetical protein
LIVDERATKVARAKHYIGVQRLNKLFLFSPAAAPFIPQTGRQVGISRGDRLLWRTFLDAQSPGRIRRRRRRRLARQSRKRNRR